MERVDKYNPAAFPHLYHPELRGKSRGYIVQRSSIFSRYWWPTEERISWHGALVRDINPAGLPGTKWHGMFATEQQAHDWPNKVRSDDIKIGPG